MFFREIWLDEGNPAYVFAKDNNVWIMGLEDDIYSNEKVAQTINEYTKDKNFSFVNILYSTNFDVMQYILDEERYKLEADED
ncbi:hypothetical protein [Paraclostridium dentum]|uniref:hypothetical protein n=1 Tax=Paraclostridium dentum TaxID=2662455 RepID=UPI003464ACF2